MRLALAGHPNSGKSTLFNLLCDAARQVGNYPGVTVERHAAHARLDAALTVELVDLPGCNSLTARSLDEEVAFAELCGEHPGGPPDAVVVVLDATQLERGLYLLLQVQELGLPVAAALNMVDRVALPERPVDAAALQRTLGLPVVALSARSGVGVDALRAGLATFCHALPKRCGTPRLAHLLLSTEEQAALGVLQADLPEGPCRSGRALWLLCAAPPQADAALRRWAASDAVRQRLATLRQQVDGDTPGGFAQQLIARRYGHIDALLAKQHASFAPPRRDADRLLLHPLGGPAIFLGVMFLLFQLTFAVAAPLMEVCGGGVLRLVGMLAGAFPAPLCRSLWVDGFGSGAANVASFVPQIALLFFGIALLEDCGYLARGACVADGLMRRVGLQGRAFVPLLSSFACAVPGVMACRTLPGRADRLLTIFIAPLMSCSARLPVYTLVIGAVFADVPPLLGIVSVPGLLMLTMYALGFLAALGTAWLLRRGVLRHRPPRLLMELPRLQIPSLVAALRQTARRCRSFVVQGGPPIVALSMLLWGVLSFPQLPADAAPAAGVAAASAPGESPEQQMARLRARRAATLRHSYGGRLGRAMEPLIAPLGFDWRIGIGLLASFAAREVLVSTLAQVYAMDAQDPSEAAALGVQLRQQRDPQTGERRLTPLRGLSLMVFFVLAMQCLSTVATVYRETASWRWPLAQLLYMNGLAYLASLLVYQGGRAAGFT